MTTHSLHTIYSRVKTDYKLVFVVPLIRHKYPKTDYLNLLYSSFFESDTSAKIVSLSAIDHWKFLIEQITGKKPLLHYHWLEFQDFKSALGMIYKLKLITFYKLFGGKLIWTIHNLKPHDGKWLRTHQMMHRWMAKRADVVLVHSEQVINDVREYYQIQNTPIEVVPHPTFPSNILDKIEARNQLCRTHGIEFSDEKKVLGIFGAISEYKKIPEIVELISNLELRVKLLVFGYVKKGQENLHHKLEVLSKEYSWFEYHPGFVEEETVPVIMSSLDACIFNFKEITTSAGIEMALAYNRTIIAPKLGDIARLDGQSDVYLFQNRDELIELLKKLGE